MSLTFDPESGKMVPSAEKAVEKSGGDLNFKNFVTGDYLSGGVQSLRQAYRRSVWVMAAIKHSFQPITSVGLQWSVDGEAVDDPELDDFWKKPAEECGGRMSLSDLVTCSVGWWKLKGEFFWILDDTWLAPGPLRMKSPILVARPDEMRQVCDRGTGELIAWEYHPRNGKGRTGQTLLPEQVIHKKAWNPYCKHRGLAEYEAAELAAETDYSAGTFSKAVMDSNGDLGPTITGEGQISDEQYEQITTAMREKRERNKRGDFRPLFLVGNQLKVNEPSIQSADAQMLANRNWNRDEIFTAFGVPASFGQVTTSYSVGSASDRFRNIEENCKPMSVLVAEAMMDVMNGHGLRPPVEEAMGGGLNAEFRWDDHSTMQEVRAERVGVAKDLVDRGISWRDVNEYLALKLPEFEGDGVRRVPFSFREVGEGDASRKAAKQRDEGEEGEEKPEKGDVFDSVAKALEMRPAKVVREERKEPAGCEICKMDGEPAEGAQADPRWTVQRALRGEWETRMRSRFSRLLMSARTETLRKLAEAGALEVDGESFAKAFEQEEKMSLIDLLFSLPDWLTEFLEGMAEVERAMIFQSSLDTWEELGIEDDPAELPERVVITTLRKRENYLIDAGADIHTQIQASIETGLENGETMDELSGRVRAAFNGINEVRAERIARTEVTAVYEAGRQATFEEAGVEFKEWVTSGLENVRLSHFQTNGQVVKIGSSFEVAGARLKHPGDSNGPAEEVINCNCIMVASLGPETEAEEGGES